MRTIIALVFTLLTWASLAQTAAPADPFEREVKWSVSESWGDKTLTYTFKTNGTFISSDWDNGKGHGTWTRSGKLFVMIWPEYNGALYRGNIEGQEIRGDAYQRNGSKIGTFVFRLLR